MHSYTNAFIPQGERLAKDTKQYRQTHTLQNMSRPLKQSHVTRHALGLYLLHEFMCFLKENKEREGELWFLFKATATSKTQVVDEQLLTDADLNISEDEAYTPGRGEGSSGDTHGKHLECKQKEALCRV